MTTSRTFRLPPWGFHRTEFPTCEDAVVDICEREMEREPGIVPAARLRLIEAEIRELRDSILAPIDG